ncbi:hypothetical protein [Candidatus Binatus sp.]|uniref:hypothetical protein n=1 Tax=Candidatus Binatus sp. TaxID=2811406 RepID=UPI003BD55D6B
MVVGVGEVGEPLGQVLERRMSVLRLDLEPRDLPDQIDVMHICFPFHNSAQFTAAVVDLIRRFDPQVTIINSTVAPGTTVAVARAAVCYSPVRGKHAEMAKALLHYVKFVAGTEARAVDAAVEHFNAVDMKIRRVSTADTLELAKLAETNLLRSLHRFCAGVETLRAGDRSQLRRSSPLFRGDRVPAASDLFSGNNRRPLRHSQHRPELLSNVVDRRGMLRRLP